jgi:hypothetical protein
MKILLDENLPRLLKLDFGPEHQIYTVQDMGWKGQKNGALLGLMVLYNFDALLTTDKNLPFQQNLARFPLLVFVLKAPNTKLETLQPLITILLDHLKQPIRQQVTIITP